MESLEQPNHILLYNSQGMENPIKPPNKKTLKNSQTL